MREQAEEFGDTMRAPQAFGPALGPALDPALGPALDPPPGADEQTKVLAFLGRRA